jgi:hypothetical protein
MRRGEEAGEEGDEGDEEGAGWEEGWGWEGGEEAEEGADEEEGSADEGEGAEGDDLGCPFAFARFGHGHVAFFGDAEGSDETADLIARVAGTPREATSA